MEPTDGQGRAEESTEPPRWRSWENWGALEGNRGGRAGGSGRVGGTGTTVSDRGAGATHASETRTLLTGDGFCTLTQAEIDEYGGCGFAHGWPIAEAIAEAIASAEAIARGEPGVLDLDALKVASQLPENSRAISYLRWLLLQDGLWPFADLDEQIDAHVAAHDAAHDAAHEDRVRAPFRGGAVSYSRRVDLGGVGALPGSSPPMQSYAAGPPAGAQGGTRAANESMHDMLLRLMLAGEQPEAALGLDNDVAPVGRGVSADVRGSAALLPSVAAADVAELELECPVCTEVLKVGVRINELPCEHVFHEECIGRWFDAHVTCPVCRKEYT